MLQRLLPAAVVRWRQREKTDRGALGRDGTHAEASHPVFSLAGCVPVDYHVGDQAWPERGDCNAW
jgi:hypothetical protein